MFIEQHPIRKHSSIYRKVQYTTIYFIERVRMQTKREFSLIYRYCYERLQMLTIVRGFSLSRFHRNKFIHSYINLKRLKGGKKNKIEVYEIIV